MQALVRNRFRSGRPRQQAVRFGLWALTATVAAVVLLVLAATSPVLAGKRSYIVLGGSMEPAIPVGAAVVTEVVHPARLKEGDIITFVTRSQQVVTHRVAAVVQDQFGLGLRTKGDANDSPDPELARPPNILGRVWYHVPFAGYILHYGNQTTTRLAVLVLAIMVAGSQLQGWALLKNLKAAARGPQEPTAPESTQQAQAPVDSTKPEGRAAPVGSAPTTRSETTGPSGPKGTAG